MEALRDKHNLTNAALVALEPRTGQVLAMVGSADYWNDARVFSRCRAWSKRSMAKMMRRAITAGSISLRMRPRWLRFGSQNWPRRLGLPTKQSRFDPKSMRCSTP